MSLSDTTHIGRSRSQLSWQKIVLITLLLLTGLGLRLFALSDIFLWNDETDNFDEQIYDQMSTSLRGYAAAEAQELTLGPAWPIIIVITCKLFGNVVTVARIPSLLFGTAAILAVFYLVYRLMQSDENERFYASAVFASALVAISAIQMEFSQRIIPYGAVPFLSTAIIIAHLKIVHVIQDKSLPMGKLILWCILYSLIGGFSVYLHLSVTMILFASLVMLFGRACRSTDVVREKRNLLFGLLLLTSLSIFLAWIGNAIHTQSGYRFYLAPYYHTLNVRAIPFLLSRAYDLLTYHLNLFYNGSLYWPRKLNPVLLPLIVLCIMGWIYSARGRFGFIAKHLSCLAIMSVFITALLSLLMKYPFGGVRQNLFMSPFIYTFTGLGFGILIKSRWGKTASGVLVVAYLVSWGANLPHFYKERVTPYTTQDLVNAWEEHGKPSFYGDGGCGETIKYMLREYPDIEAQDLDYESDILPEPPFFLISPRWPMECSLWLSDLKGRIEQSGCDVELIMVRNAAYPAHRDYRQCLYSPANGLWLYKITEDESREF